MPKSLRDKLFKTKIDFFKKDTEEEHPVTTLLTYKNGDFLSVRVKEILPNPDQPRQHFDEKALSELTQSIKEKGVLQPVIVRVDRENEKVYLVAGERRLKAAKKAGLEKIPAVVTTGDPAEIALIENLQREDLNPIDEAEALEKLMQKHKYKQETLASVVGKAKSTISEALSLNRLPNSIKNEVRRAELFPRRLLVQIAKQNTIEAQLSLFKKIRENNLSSTQVREIARKRKKKPESTPEAVVLAKVKSLYKDIGKIDLSTFDHKKRSQLKKLKELLEEILG